MRDVNLANLEDGIMNMFKSAYDAILKLSLGYITVS